MTLSLCMIVKNEGEVLARCLESVRDVVDEIIIVDTGSTDDTKDVARRYTDHVYDFVWIDDFSAARNAAFEKATMDYILWLDADDILPESEREKLLALKATLPEEILRVMMPYGVGFDESGRVNFSFDRERIVKRAAGFRWEEPVHEYIAAGGPVQRADIWIHHKKVAKPAAGRNLRIYEKQLAEGKTLTPRGRFYYARELMYNGRQEEAIESFELFLHSGKGWVEDNIRACLDIASCLKALERPRLESILRSFQYDAPRAESCCLAAECFAEQKRFDIAARWYELALRLPATGNTGFTSHEFSGFYPLLQLCVCYDRLGDKEKAKLYNEQAGRLKPDHPSVVYNKAYFGD